MTNYKINYDEFINSIPLDSYVDCFAEVSLFESIDQILTILKLHRTFNKKYGNKDYLCFT